MIDQQTRSIFGRQLLHARDQLDDITAAVTGPETAEPVEGWRYDQTTGTIMFADRARATKLRAGLFQWDAEPVTDGLDADLIADRFEIQSALFRHVHTSLC